MKRKTFITLAVVALAFCLTGCSEPNRWHQPNPTHGEPGQQDELKHGMVGSDNSFGTGMGSSTYQRN